MFRRIYSFRSRLVIKLSLAVVAAAAVPQMARADVAINATNFPDNYFRDYVSENFDADGNGKLSSDEIENVTEINCPSDCSSLKGIEHFVNLTYLSASGNPFASVDLSKNAQLEHVELNYCPNLKTIKWGDVSKVKELYLYDSGVEGFSLEDFTSLEDFDIRDCKSWGTTLDISWLSNLWYVYLSGSSVRDLVAKGGAWGCSFDTNEQFESLDGSDDESLEEVYLSDFPNLETFVFENCPNLKAFVWSGNHNTSIDLSGIPTLEYVELNYCPNLKTIKWGDVSKVKNLYLYDSGVEAFSLKDFTSLEYFDIRDCKSWGTTIVDLDKATRLSELYVDGSSLAYLNLESNKELTYTDNMEVQPTFTLTLLSQNEVGIAVGNDFNVSKVTKLTTNKTATTPKTATVDGQLYYVVYGEASTANALKDKSIAYQYLTGYINDDSQVLEVSGKVKSVVKCPSFLKLSAATVSCVYGGTVTAPSVIRSQDYDGQLTFVSSNPEVVTVAEDGQLTIVGAGTATITVSGAETDYRLAPEAVTYEVTVKKASPKFSFANATVESVAKDAVPANELNVGVYDGTVKYTSSDENVAKVGADGMVTTLKGGTVTITATGEATDNCNKPESAAYTLTVKKRTTTVTLAATTVNGVYGGEIAAPTATIGNDSDGQLTYMSSNENVVKADNSGKLTITGAGEATVTVSSTETELYYAAEPVAFKVVIAKATPVFSFEEPEMKGDAETELEENVLDAGVYDGQVVYTSSDTSIADVDAATGKVTLKFGGTVTITAKGEATGNCNETSASYIVTVYHKGDVNHDGVVDVADIANVIDQMADGTYKQQADVNRDNVVDVADIAAIIDQMAALARLLKMKD